MRFAEVFLRLGSSLVGWMLIYTYAVWLAALSVAGGRVMDGWWSGWRLQ